MRTIAEMTKAGLAALAIALALLVVCGIVWWQSVGVSSASPAALGAAAAAPTPAGSGRVEGPRPAPPHQPAPSSAAETPAPEVTIDHPRKSMAFPPRGDRAAGVTISPPPPATGPRGVPLTGAPENTRRLLEWAATDLEAAVLWADRLPDPERRQEALQSLCFKVAERDPAAALDMAESYGVGEGAGVMENLIAQLSNKDSEAALSWALRRPAGKRRDEAVARVAFALSASQPAEAGRVVEELMSPGPAQIEAAASVANQWVQRDAAAAAAWAETLPPGAVRDRVRQEISNYKR